MPPPSSLFPKRLQLLQEMQGILGHTAPSCCHSCLGCEWNFKHNNKMASAVPPPPSPQPDLLFSSPVTLETQPEEQRRKEEKAEQPDLMRKHIAPPMKQLPSGRTHYHRLMIWFNYVDKTGGRTFGALSECLGVKRLRLQLNRGIISVLSQLLTSWSETAHNVCLCLHAGHVQWDCYCPAIKAAEVWFRLHNPSPLSGWKVSLNELSSAPPGY